MPTRGGGALIESRSKDHQKHQWSNFWSSKHSLVSRLAGEDGAGEKETALKPGGQNSSSVKGKSVGLAVVKADKGNGARAKPEAAAAPTQKMADGKIL